MAGTLFSLGLSQRLDSEGKPLINAPLYLYEANTSTPVDAFQDFGLEVLHPWPIRTDSAGMIPAFWLDDGNYRARFTDEEGAIVYFDIPNMQTLGPSVGGGGGGGGGSVDPNAIFQTGDMLWQPRSGTRSGWVRANRRTIGSASSGATERANADTQALFEFLWNTFSDTICPVAGGRGGSAASDFAANKAIATLDMRGRGPIGLDDMGNSAAKVITAETPTVAGSGGGQETPSITIAKANLPNITLTGETDAAGQHYHFIANTGANGSELSGSNTMNPDRILGSNSPNYSLVGSGGGASRGQTSLEADHVHSISLPLGGSGTPLTPNTMSPYRLGTWYLRL